MNRHQSNPFLAGWDESEQAESYANNQLAHNGANIFDIDATIDDQQDIPAANTQTRRHSSSQADITGNPFGAQRQVADRRLYHRNMSSFEAASLQLEHQQQMQLNGTIELSANQTDLIAKMVADFQTAIETNDKQFQQEFDSGSNNGKPLDFNPFDPFETIVDDDISLPSPGIKTQPQTNKQNESAEKPVELHLKEPTVETHDSIDDDDADLVSTPVRNIKSSPMKSLDSQDQPTNIEDETSKIATEGSPIQTIESGTDSMSKASLFASLLAEAELPQQVKANDIEETDPSIVPAEVLEGDARDPENSTHVIKGSPISGEGANSSRPVGFFDPFETVIDKDALSSLLNEIGTEQSDSINNNNLSSPTVPMTESASVETVIENRGDLSCQVSSGSGSEQPAGSIPRPTVNKPTCNPQLVGYLRTTPAKSRAKQSVKNRQQDDSMDSSEEDERIQIVIKAREPKVESTGDSGAPATFVPLLPPPPSKSSMKQARERGQVEEFQSPVASFKIQSNKITKKGKNSDSDWSDDEPQAEQSKVEKPQEEQEIQTVDDEEDESEGKFVIHMTKDLSADEEGEDYLRPDTPLYDDDTSYVLEEFPSTYEGDGWHMMLRYPPKKKLTSNRFWKKIFVRLAEVPLAIEKSKTPSSESQQQAATCIALQIFDKPEDKKPMQEIPIQATYTVSEISSQQFDQFGKIFTIKLQYIFYKERVGVRQGQIARFIHSGHIGSSTTSGGHGVDPISIGAIKRMGAPIEHSPQISQIIKLGCTQYESIRQFKACLEDHLFKMVIHRDRALSTYKTEEVQMAVRDETYLELNQIGQVVKQLARVRLFFLSFLNGMPTVEVGINDISRQGREVVGRMDILPVVTEEWIRLEAWELHPTIEREQFENPESRIIKLVPPDATFFELMRFRVRPPRNRELPLQVSANMSVTRTKVSINCEVMVPGEVSRKHGQIPCENIAIRVHIPECWIYFFREEKHFRMGSKKSVNRRPGKVKGIERFLGGSGGLQDVNDDSSLIEVTSGQAKYEHHHHAIVWRAARWPKESQSSYVQNTMKIRLPLTAYDKMPDSFYEYLHVEYTMPATTVSHTTLRSISVNPCDDEPAEKYVKYSSKYEYKVKMRLTVNLGARQVTEEPSQASPVIIMKQLDTAKDLQREEDSPDDEDDDEEN